MPEATPGALKTNPVKANFAVRNHLQSTEVVTMVVAKKRHREGASLGQPQGRGIPGGLDQRQLTSLTPFNSVLEAKWWTMNRKKNAPKPKIV